MKILTIGSLNVDHVYAVDHFVKPGETLASASYSIFAGGKGFNQSIALARAGATALHAGKIGADATWLKDRLAEEGVEVDQVIESETPTGHAMIQVVPSGENSIVLYGGANQMVSSDDLSRALLRMSEGDWLLLQNEISSVAEAIRLGKERGLKVVLNPGPMNPEVLTFPLDLVDLFVLNETEAEGLTGETHPPEIRRVMNERFPHAATVLTRGSRGAIYFDLETELFQPSAPVDAVDTTAAGDTFIGYFLAELLQMHPPEKALERGCRAAEICVTRSGASDSIPKQNEVL